MTQKKNFQRSFLGSWRRSLGGAAARLLELGYRYSTAMANSPPGTPLLETELTEDELRNLKAPILVELVLSSRGQKNEL
jgi:hypothetical protein